MLIVQYAVADVAATVTLNKLEKLKALDDTMIQAQWDSSAFQCDKRLGAPSIGGEIAISACDNAVKQ